MRFVVGAVLVLGAAACGMVERKPVSSPASEPVRAAVARGFTQNALTGGLSPKDYTVTDVRLAGSDPTWAWGRIRSTGTWDKEPPAPFVMHEKAGRWELTSLGDAVDIACDVAPKDVLADLGVDCSGPRTTRTS